MKREQCTPENPYSGLRAKEKPGSKWWHQEAHEVPGSQQQNYPNGDSILIRCDSCGMEWWEELGQ